MSGLESQGETCKSLIPFCHQWNWKSHSEVDMSICAVYRGTSPSLQTSWMWWQTFVSIELDAYFSNCGLVYEALVQEKISLQSMFVT